MTDEEFSGYYAECAAGLLKWLSRAYGIDRAQDIASEAWMHAWRARDTFRNDGRFFSWLSRIAHNAACSMHRGLSGRSMDLEEPFTLLVTQSYCSSSTVERALIAGQAIEAIERRIARLKPRELNLFRMRYVDDLSYEEIAGALRLKVNTVKVRITRVRAVALRSA